MFSSHSLFSLPPKRFGCTCFVFDVRSHVTKLYPKSLKCAFLDYCRIQKGHCCFSPDLGCYLVSADVSLFEDHLFLLSPNRPCQCDSDDFVLTYSSTHYIPPTPIATGFKFFEQTYSRRPQVSREDIPKETQPLPPPMPVDSANGLPIVLRKGKCTCTYPIFSYVSSCLLPSTSNPLLLA